MGYQNPSYSFIHAARTAGAASITASPAAAAGFPVDNLIDDRAGSLFKFSSSGTDHKIDVDRGSGTLEGVNRLLIPAGHNLTGTILVQEDDNSGFTSPTTFFSGSSVSAGLIDKSLGATSTERYLRIQFQTSGQWEIPQLIYTFKRTPATRGPEPEWRDQLIDNTLLFPKPSGIVAALELGPDQRTFELVYHRLDATDDDVFADLWTECATARPFYFDPPDDSQSPVWVRLSEPIERSQDYPAPKLGTFKYRRRLRIIEHLA